MNLNPLKCTFAIHSGKFLEYIVSAHSIEAILEKIEVVKGMVIPEKPTDLMSLNGRVAALNRFIFKATNKCISFFNQV